MLKKNKICFLLSNDASRDPRVTKEANSAAKAGFKVSTIAYYWQNPDRNFASLEKNDDGIIIRGEFNPNNTFLNNLAKIFAAKPFTGLLQKMKNLRFVWRSLYIARHPYAHTEALISRLTDYYPLKYIKNSFKKALSAKRSEMIKQDFIPSFRNISTSRNQIESSQESTAKNSWFLNLYNTVYQLVIERR